MSFGTDPFGIAPFGVIAADGVLRVISAIASVDAERRPLSIPREVRFVEIPAESRIKSRSP
jgi:hypothetical protein